MKYLKKTNLPVVLAFFAPLLMIVIVAASVYIPRLYTKPMYDFVYVSGVSAYRANELYEVIDGKITKKANPPFMGPLEGMSSTDKLPVEPQILRYDEPSDTDFYRYEVATHSSKKLTYDEVSKLSINDDNTSPDGFRVERGGTGGSMLFGGSYDYDTWYLKKGTVLYKLPRIRAGASHDIYVFGWIK